MSSTRTSLVPTLLEFIRYTGASVGALLVDFGLLLTLAQFMHYAIAASLSFMAGALVHYLISVRFVFAERRLRGRQWLESGAFILIGAAGLSLNLAIISACMEWTQWPLAAAKMLAAGASFVFGYTIRKLSLFR